jgi:hypothetical protein
VDSPRKPLLASEALREELAPATPWSRSARGWAAAAAAICVGAATVQFLTGEIGASVVVSILVIATLVAAAVLPLPYPRRALALLVTGVFGTAAGALGAGAAAVPASTPGALAHAVAATALGGALLFRSRFRAYAPARRFLGLALLAALPLVIWCGYLLLRGSFAVQLAAAVTLIAMTASLLGFMGQETDIGESIAAVVVGGVVLELGSEAVSARWPPQSWRIGQHLVGPLAFGALAVVAALGLAQWLAHRSWREARERASQVPPRDSAPNFEDTWSG